MPYKIAIKQQALSILTGARGLINLEGGWTKHTFARNDAGITVDTHSRGATCFCALGAIERAAGVNIDEDNVSAIMYAEEKLAGITEDGFIASFNDASRTTQLDMLIAFDFAILELEDEIVEGTCAAS